MKPIILHIGDRVHHKTLGHGIVIAVNDDYCTARFGEKEANFRIPEAFVRGFLTSEDARFGSEDSDEQMVEEIISENKEPGKDKPIDWWTLIAGLIGLAIISIPLIAFFLMLYRSDCGVFFLWLAVILFIEALVLMVYIIWCAVNHKPFLGKTTSIRSTNTELIAGMMGAEMLHRAAEKERQEAEKRRYESLYWQESIRDKNPRHDFDYDHKDDWLGTD